MYHGPKKLHLSVQVGPSHEWILGVPFNPVVTVTLNDPDEQPVHAWNATIEIKAYLINGVGDVVREGYDDRTSLLGNVSFLDGNTATFPELRVMIPASQTKCGWFQLAFVSVDYMIAPALSDRFAILEERRPRHPGYLLDTDSALEITFGTPSDPSKTFDATPLHVAVTRGEVSLCHLLLEKGDRADTVGTMGIAPLHVAAYLGLDRIVQMLIDRGADIERKTEGGLTPFHIAIIGGQVETAKLLLAHDKVYWDRDGEMHGLEKWVMGG